MQHAENRKAMGQGENEEQETAHSRAADGTIGTCQAVQAIRIVSQITHLR